MRKDIIVATLMAAIGATPTIDAAVKKRAAPVAKVLASPKPAPVTEPPAPVDLPDAPLVALEGCPAPASGTMAIAKRIDRKARGKFSIEKAPFIATLDPGALCAGNRKMRSGAGDTPGSMGLSAQVMNTRSARMDLMAIPALEAELRPVLTAFAGAWPYAPLERTPKILFRADVAYQAQALPDNSIIVSMGLIEAANADSEILFVLAHEYAHLLLGHFTKAETIAGAREATQAVSLAWQAGGAFTAIRNGGVDNMLGNARSGSDQGARRAAPVAEALRLAVDDIVAPSWNRDQENEADALAIDLLIRSNMTIDSYANVFARLQKAFENEKASHDARRRAADAAAADMGNVMKGATADAVAGGLGNASSLQSLGMNLFRTGNGSLLANMGNITKSLGGDTHLPPEERRNGLAAYFQAGYPTADPPIDNGALVALIKAKPDFGRAIALRDAYLKARASYFSQDYAGAALQLRALGAGTGGRTVPIFVHYVAGLAARDAGDVHAAASFFDAGRIGPVQNLQLYETYTEMELKAGDVAASERLIAEGKDRFKDPDHFKSLEIRRDLAAGDMAGAQSVYAACLAIRGRDYINERCKAAMPQAQQQQTNPLGIKLPFGG